jgi:hypothetical protein
MGGKHETLADQHHLKAGFSFLIYPRIEMPGISPQKRGNMLPSDSGSLQNIPGTGLFSNGFYLAGNFGYFPQSSCVSSHFVFYSNHY